MTELDRLLAIYRNRVEKSVLDLLLCREERTVANVANLRQSQEEEQAARAAIHAHVEELLRRTP